MTESSTEFSNIYITYPSRQQVSEIYYNIILNYIGTITPNSYFKKLYLIIDQEDGILICKRKINPNVWTDIGIISFV